jgi:hypothetical protein
MMRKEQIAKLAKSIFVVQDFNPYDFAEGDAAGSGDAATAGSGASSGAAEAASPSTPASPKVSIYIPAKHEEREQRQDTWDKIEFKHLVDLACAKLARDFDEQDYTPITERLDYIASNPDLPLWIDAAAGLAFLVSAEKALVFNMSHAPKAQVCVGKSFCIMPLIYDMQLSHSSWTDKCAARLIEPHDITREIMFEAEQGQQEKIMQKVGLALAKDKASTNIDDIAAALTERKVAVLFIENGLELTGVFDERAGKILPAANTDANTNADADTNCADSNLCEAFIRAALLQDAAVYVLDPDKMPVQAPICAMYRY